MPIQPHRHTAPSPISLVHSQQLAQARHVAHQREEEARMHHARVKQALRAAAQDGFSRGVTAGWWRGFYPGLFVGALMVAGTVAAFLIVSQWSLRA